MSINLTDEEQHLAELFSDSTQMHEPLSSLESSVYTVLLTRGYSGRKARLIRIVRYFNPDADNHDIASAFDVLDRRRLVRMNGEEVQLPDEWLTSLSGALRPRGGLSGSVLQRVERSRQSYEADRLERVGRTSSDGAVRRVRTHILQAAHSIRLGCFSSSVLFDDVGEVLAEACSKRFRMHLQVLMYSPDLGISIEQDPTVQLAIENGLDEFDKLFVKIRDKASAANNHPTCELRWLGRNDAEFAGVHRMLIVDDRAWMLNVYSIGVDRGVDGILHQGSSMRETPTTIYRIINHYWQSAWARAEPKLSISTAT